MDQFEYTIEEMMGDGTDKDSYDAFYLWVYENIGLESAQALSNAVEATDDFFYFATKWQVPMVEAFLTAK